MYVIHLLQRCEDAKSRTVAGIDSNRTFVLVTYEEVLQNANMFGMFFVMCLRNKGADEELLMLESWVSSMETRTYCFAQVPTCHSFEFVRLLNALDAIFGLPVCTKGMTEA